jgi:signal transduction histidine kinase
MEELEDLIRLGRPTHYEKRSENQGANAPIEVRRFQLLEHQITRLIDAGWLNSEEGVLSFHLLDWDLRKSEKERFNKHIPMHAWDRGVLIWYSILGLLIASDPSRMRYTLTHHVFEQMPRRDAVEIGISSNSDIMFSVRQASFGKNPMLGPSLEAMSNVVEEVETEQRLIKISVGMPKIREVLGTLDGFRNRLHAIVEKKMVGITMPWDGTLEEAQGFLLEDEAIWSDFSNDLEQAVDVFGDLLKRPLEQPEYTENVAPLVGTLQTPTGIDAENLESIRRFLASLALVAFLAPSDLHWRRIALIPGVSCIEDDHPLSSEGFFLVLNQDWPDDTWTKWMLLANLWAREKAVFDLREKTKEQEQRQSVAFASHILATPLRGVSALVRRIPAGIPQKDAINREVTLMQALERFSTRLTNPSKDLPGFKTTTDEEFFEYLSTTIRDLCSILQNPDVNDNAGMAFHVRRDQCLWDAIATGLKLPSRRNHALVKWNTLQLYAVVDGVLSNALRHNRTDDQAYIRIRLEYESNGSGKRVLFVVSSATDLPWEELNILADDLTTCKNTDWIGVSLIHRASRVCGFQAPKWQPMKLSGHPEAAILEAYVQIGVIERSKK